MVAVVDPDDVDTRTLLELAAGVCGVPVRLVADETAALAALPAAGSTGFVRIRTPHGASAALLSEARARGVTVDEAPVTGSGIVELPHWLLEQAVSRSMHRYGRLGCAGQADAVFGRAPKAS